MPSPSLHAAGPAARSPPTAPPTTADAERTHRRSRISGSVMRVVREGAWQLGQRFTVPLQHSRRRRVGGRAEGWAGRGGAVCCEALADASRWSCACARPTCRASLRLPMQMAACDARQAPCDGRTTCNDAPAPALRRFAIKRPPLHPRRSSAPRRPQQPVSARAAAQTGRAHQRPRRRRWFRSTRTTRPRRSGCSCTPMTGRSIYRGSPLGLGKKAQQHSDSSMGWVSSPAQQSGRCVTHKDARARTHASSGAPARRRMRRRPSI